MAKGTHAFAEDPSSVPSTHIGQLTIACNTSSRKSNAPLLASIDAATHIRSNTHRHNTKHITKEKKCILKHHKTLYGNPFHIILYLLTYKKAN